MQSLRDFIVECELGILQQLHLKVHEGSAIVLRSRRLLGSGVGSDSSSVSSGTGGSTSIECDLKVSEKFA